MTVRTRVGEIGWPNIDRRQLFGGLLAAVAAVLVLVLTQPADQIPVLVAGGDIPAGMPLQDLDIEVHYVDDASGLVEGSSTGDLDEWTLASPLSEGEPLLPSLLRPPAMTQRPQMLALSLSSEHAVLGHLTAGDEVDVYVTRDGTADSGPVVERVASHVYVISSEMSDNPASRNDVKVLVAVDDELAPLLAQAARSGGMDLVKVSP